LQFQKPLRPLGSLPGSRRPGGGSSVPGEDGCDFRPLDDGQGLSSLDTLPDIRQNLEDAAGHPSPDHDALLSVRLDNAASHHVWVEGLPGNPNDLDARGPKDLFGQDHDPRVCLWEFRLRRSLRSLSAAAGKDDDRPYQSPRGRHGPPEAVEISLHRTTSVPRTRFSSISALRASPRSSIVLRLTLIAVR